MLYYKNIQINLTLKICVTVYKIGTTARLVSIRVRWQHCLAHTDSIQTPVKSRSYAADRQSDYTVIWGSARNVYLVNIYIYIYIIYIYIYIYIAK